MEVDTDVLLFTQDSISCRFRDGRRIDDAVDSILRGEKQASDFPPLQVVKHGGRLWSLDNRRLWVFRKARVPRITVDLVPYDHHTRFTKLMENEPELQKRILQRGYWPPVRGLCRTEFWIPGTARISPHPRRPRFPRPIYVNEQPRNGIEDWPRPINTPVSEWDFRRERFTEQQTMESDEEEQKQAAKIDSRFHTVLYLGVVIVIVVLFWTHGVDRAGENKLTVTRTVHVIETPAQRVPTGTTTASYWPEYFGAGIARLLFWTVSEIFGRLVPAVIHWLFLGLSRLMWELLFGWFM